MAAQVRNRAAECMWRPENTVGTQSSGLLWGRSVASRTAFRCGASSIYSENINTRIRLFSGRPASRFLGVIFIRVAS